MGVALAKTLLILILILKNQVIQVDEEGHIQHPKHVSYRSYHDAPQLHIWSLHPDYISYFVKKDMIAFFKTWMIEGLDGRIMDGQKRAALQWWFVNPGSDRPEISLVRTKGVRTDFRFRTNGQFSNPENSLISREQTRPL